MELKRSEDQLIIECMHVNLDQERIEAIATLVNQDLDWQHIIPVVTRNRVISLFYHSLSSVPDITIPDDIRTQLKTAYQLNSIFCLQLKGELIRVLRLFETKGIRALPLKGPVLAETVYHNLGLRESGDLDILVSDADYSTAEALLLASGYEVADKTEKKLNILNFNTEYHRKFINTHNSIPLELHWKLIEPYRGILPINQVPAELIVNSTYENSSVQLFKEEFLLLFLCVHGYKHHWERLSWLCDVSELVVTTPDLDWNLVYQLAKRFYLLEIVSMGLFLVDDILGCKIPAEYRDYFQYKPKISHLADFVEQQIFATVGLQEGSRRITDDYLEFNYDLLTKPSHRIRYLYEVALGRIRWQPNERDREWINLPRRATPVYFLIRPIRLVYQYGSKYLKTIYKILVN